MQKLLRKAVHTCFINGQVDHDAMHNYFMSVTEREVINGVLNVDNTKAHCLAYVRYINNINLQNIKKASNFIDIINRGIDTEAARLLSNLRDERLFNKIEATNFQKYTVEWMGREGISNDTHEEYLSSFLAHFYKNITKLVDRAMRKEDSSAQGVIVTEILQHLHACNNSVKVFYGREQALELGKEYILGSSDKPMILYGQGGCGKTSLLAKMAAMSFDWIKSTPLLILRFLGTTPDSSALTPMLISLCQQISYNFMLSMEDIPDDLVPLTAHFKNLLTYGSVDQPLLVFLDSVDQLTGASGANKLTWLPSKLPKYCKIVISCVYEPEDDDISADYLLLRRIIDDEKCFLEVTSLGELLATVVIRRWLVAANRDVNNFQWRVVRNALSECSLPIFVKLVFAEICRWKSYSKPNDTILAENVNDSIFKLFERIEIQHGKLLVTHALAYITAAKSGLSETELEDLISLDDKVLDDVYQYHLPPVRRIPPLLWTRIRNDLPNYLSEREADGVSVLSWYHRQFRDAAKDRYFKDEGMSIYFHASIADYFLGLWGGGNPKPFQYTEIQKHRFGLKDKNAAADRKVPQQPLVYVGKDGKISRYNLRKFGELPYHLVRSKRFTDLYHNVLFNYKWLHAKISSCPLQSCLSDFEDACNHVDDRESSREIMLVADALRLGGAVLMHHSQMLAPQLVGRLLPEIGGNPNVKRLLDQCDTEGIEHCALMPSYHCLHTPGGPLKYSLEGHQFAVFGFCLTADFRYIISISNKFITWDLSSSDMCRDVTPGIEGILQGLCISPDNRYAAAFSNINQVILLNMLTNEYMIFENPFASKRLGICGLSLLNMHLIVYCGKGAVVYNSLTGEIDTVLDDIVVDREYQIFRMTYYSLEEFDVIYWTGNLDDTEMKMIRWTKEDGKSEALGFQGAVVIHPVNQNKLFACIDSNVQEFHFSNGKWIPNRIYDGCDKLIQLALSQDDKFAIGTFMFGYKAWNLESKKMVTLLLPDNGIRNISTKPLESNSCVMSKDNVYAIAGVRKNLYVWDMITGDLLKNLDAHFGRIIKIQSLTIGNWNSVITSSIDRTVKVWNINNIFEQVHVIDRHELQIDGISISPDRNVAATVTRNCVGIWDLRTGRMIDKLADSPLGAIVTHAVITKNGKHVATSESGHVLIWKFPEDNDPDGVTSVIHKDEQEAIKQLFFIDKDNIIVAVSKIMGGVGGAEMRSLVKARLLVPDPEAETDSRQLYEFEYPIKNLRNLTVTSDGSLLVGPGFEKLKDTLFIYISKTGQLMHKIVLKYSNFKDYTSILAVPKRATQIALIDSDKGNILDVKTKRFIRSVSKWGGKCTKDGKYGLYAPGRGGLELIELKHGKTVRTFIPKVAEGVFTIICMFNKTDEYVLYYHGGRKTIRVFRTSDAVIIANYRVPAELSSIESTTDGKSIVLGTVDGCLTVLAVADPFKGQVVRDYLKSLPSRDAEKTKKLVKRCPPFYFRTAAKMAALAARVKRNSGDVGGGGDRSGASSSSGFGRDEVRSVSSGSFVETSEGGVTISSEADTVEEENSSSTLKGEE